MGEKACCVNKPQNHHPHHDTSWYETHVDDPCGEEWARHVSTVTRSRSKHSTHHNGFEDLYCAKACRVVVLTGGKVAT